MSDATFRVVKNTLTERAADDAEAQSLKELLSGPTALTFVRGDAASAAKAISTFNKETELLAFKGGIMNGETLEVAQIKAIAKLPSREVLYGQLVGIVAAPLGGLARGLGGLLGGLAIALGQLQQQKESGEVPAGEAPAAAAEPEAEAAPEAEAPEAEAEADATEAERLQRPKPRPRPRHPPKAPEAEASRGSTARPLPTTRTRRTLRPRPDSAPKRPPRENTDMATSTQDWIEELKGISVLELAERIKALEEEFGVSATAVAAAAPAAGGGGGGEAAEEESSTVDVMLTGAGDKKIQVIKVVRAATGLGPEGGQGRSSTRRPSPSRRASSATRPTSSRRSSRRPARASSSSSRGHGPWQDSPRRRRGLMSLISPAHHDGRPTGRPSSLRRSSGPAARITAVTTVRARAPGRRTRATATASSFGWCSLVVFLTIALPDDEAGRLLLVVVDAATLVVAVWTSNAQTRGAPEIVRHRGDRWRCSCARSRWWSRAMRGPSCGSITLAARRRACRWSSPAASPAPIRTRTASRSTRSPAC